MVRISIFSPPLAVDPTRVPQVIMEGNDGSMRARYVDERR
jgi:hypothetical protein